jgi:cytochrome c
MRFLPWACAAILCAHASFSLAVDAARGKTLYESRCIGCHSIDANRVGPAHKGVFGRKAGAAKGYDYSPAVKASRLVWNERTLDRWLSNPEATIPGNKMGYSVPDSVDRADIIEYLRSAK